MLLDFFWHMHTSDRPFLEAYWLGVVISMVLDTLCVNRLWLFEW